jgi:hypothetical protein
MTAVTNDLSEYEHRGDILSEHVLTPQDKRRQGQAERLAEHVRAVVATAPPLTDEQRSRLRTLLSSTPRPAGDLMRWQVRHYCGHSFEWAGHRSDKTVAAAFTTARVCRTCGLDPATIVAAAPIGPASDLNDPQLELAQLEAELGKVSRKALAAERDHRRLTDRAAQLRQLLEAARAGGGAGDRRFHRPRRR